MAKLGRVILFVKDLIRMTSFYRDALGLRFVSQRSSDGWSELDTGGTSLGLHLIPAEVAQNIQITDPPRRRSETPFKLVFEVGDLDAARATAIAFGATMSERSSWGSCDGLDPEGNVFQLVESRA